MFDLNRQIAQWRQTMMDGGLADPVVLDELESHLRDYVEQQVSSGRDAEAAFKAGTERIGAAGELRREFRRADGLLSLSRLNEILDNRQKRLAFSMVSAVLISVGFYWSKVQATSLYRVAAMLQVIHGPIPSVVGGPIPVEDDIRLAERFDSVLRRLSSDRLKAEVMDSFTPAEKIIIRHAEVTRQSSSAEPLTSRDWLGKITIHPVRRAFRLYVSVTHRDAEAAALIANRFADQLRKSFDASGISIRLLDRATPPRKPYVPDRGQVLQEASSLCVILFAGLMGIAEAMRRVMNSRRKMNPEARLS